MTTRRLCVILVTALLAALATLSTAWADAPARIPVQGVLSDASGAPIDATLPVRFALYTQAQGGEPVWAEEQQVAFDRGAFAASLGVVEALPLEVFRDEGALWLGLSIGDDPETTRLALDTAPYAAFAQYAANADSAASLNGFEPEDFAAAEHDTPFDSIVDLPDGLADGDDDTTYTAGAGLQLQDDAFGLTLDCAPGQVLQRSDSGWDCQDPAGGDATDELIAAFTLDGTLLSVTDAGQTFSVDLSGLQDGTEDDDADPTNELISNVAFDGANLTITDAGQTHTLDLTALRNDGDSNPDNELLIAASLDGTTLQLTDAGQTFAIDLSSLAEDADADPENELITRAELNGVSLVINEAGRNYIIDMRSLIDDDDADPENELITDVTFDGADLAITDPGGTHTVDLSSLRDGVDDADADPDNELITDVTLNGTTLTITDPGGARSVELNTVAYTTRTRTPTSDRLISGRASFTSPDIVIGEDGLPTLCAFDGNGVYVIHCDDTDCASSTRTRLSGTGDGDCQLALGPNGLVMGAYEASDDPRVVTAFFCDDTVCSSPREVALTNGPAADTRSPAVALGADGLPVFAFHNRDAGSITVAHCDTPACDTFTLNAVYSGPNPSAYKTDLIIGIDGNPLLTFLDADLVTVHCADAACASATTTTHTLPQTGAFGSQASVALGADGLPIISAFDGATTSLNVAHCERPDCSAATLTQLDNDGNVGTFNDITIGADGLPIITYHDILDQNHRIGSCRDRACTSISILEFGTAAEQEYGAHAAITTGPDGYTYVVYFSGFTQDFRMRRLPLGRGLR